MSPLGCSCPARPRPWEGSTPPQLCGVRGGRLRPFPSHSRRSLPVLTFTVFVVASLTPTSAPRYRLTRPASGPAWAGARLRIPFPLQAQSAAGATGSGGGKAGDVGREGGGRGEGGAGRGRERRAGAPPPLARLQTHAPESRFSKP